MNIMQEESKVILKFLYNRGVNVNMTDGYKTPGFHVYCMEIDATQRISKLEETLDDMQSALYAWRAKNKLIDANDPDVRVVCRTQAQPLALEVNRPQIKTLFFETLARPSKPFVALAGVSYLTKQGQPLMWNMVDPSQPHALVAGGTGSGKSNLLLSLALSLALGTAPEQLAIYVVDGGNSTLLQLSRLPHTRHLATDTEEALSLVGHIKALVLDRKAKSLDKPANRCLLIVDELANLMAVMDKKTVESFQMDLAVIAAEGRKFGIHMLVCTQKPLAEVTGSLAKSNMAVRFVGSMSSKVDANTAAGSPGTGAERLAGKGDFVRVVGGNVRRFQVPMVDDPIMILRKINAMWADHKSVEPEQVIINTPIIKRDEIDDIADSIFILWKSNASKNAMSLHAFGKPFAGSYAGKINAAIERLQEGGSSSTMPSTGSTHTSGTGIINSSSRRDEKIIRFPRKANGG